MNLMQQTLEMRGMSRSEIIDYFNSICSKEGETFQWQGCRVEVGSEISISLGSIKVPSAKVTFGGEKNCVESLIAQFRLKFLSAGG